MSKNLFFIFILSIFLNACADDSPPAGVVATVNGEPIYLHSLETLLDSRSAEYTYSPQLSVEDMQKNYSRALGVLLTHALVRQELKQRGIKLSEKNNEAIHNLQEEMGEEGLNTILTEASIRRDDWEQLMWDNFAIETFRNQVLLPQIKIELDEIKEYYQKNKDNFKLPPYIRACFLTASEKADLEARCKDLDPQDLTESPLVFCADIENEMLPPPWHEEQSAMKLNVCGKIREENGNWHTVVVISRSKERSLKLSELYALIEKILLEKKEKAAFDKWLEEKVAASSIMVTPELNITFIDEESSGKPQ